MAVECQFAVVSTAECGGYVIYDFGIKQTLRLHEDFISLYRGLALQQALIVRVQHL